MTQLLLDVLARFEKEVDSLSTPSLIKFFCLQIIPFLKGQVIIDLVRRSWRTQYEKASRQAVDLEEAALREVTTVFRAIEKDAAVHKDLKQKIAHINAVLSGKSEGVGFSSRPLYIELFCEIKTLLEMLLHKPGGFDICKNYAQLGTREKLLTRQDDLSEIETVPCIITYTFAPSVEQAGLAADAIHWKRTKDPAVVWHYFEWALWCWGTPESYFENVSNLLGKNTNPFPLAYEKAVWQEISMVKNRTFFELESELERRPIVFTGQFFREGLRTLVNEVMAFLSNGSQLKDNVGSSDAVGLELVLNENKLWLFVYLDPTEPKKFYLKRFNEGGLSPSAPYEFIRCLLEKYSGGGEVFVKLADKSENIPKTLERIGIKDCFKNLFFGQSRGTKVLFYGKQVYIPRDKKCRLLLQKLEEIHRKSGSPEYA